MTGIDPVSGISSVLTLWKRGSLLLWALGCSAASVALVLGIYIVLTHDHGVQAWILYASLAAIVLLILAGFKTYQEKTTKTMAFSTDEAQSFVHHARQSDGRQLTQIALRGKVSNTSTKPVYLTDVKLVRPRARKVLNRHILTESAYENSYGFENAVPEGGRAGFSADLMVEGFLGTGGQPMLIVIVITDQFGNRHIVNFPRVPNR